MTIAEGGEFVTAVVVATEVPPQPKGAFTDDMIALAIRCVINVMRTRAALGTWGSTLVEVALAHNQFSAVCSQDYWRKAMAGLWFPNHVARCLAQLQAASSDEIAPGATHYYSPISMVPPMSVPGWAPAMTEVVVPGLDRDFFRFFK